MFGISVAIVATAVVSRMPIINADPPPPTKTILLIGDSITVGHDQNGGWRPILQQLFNSVGQPVHFEMLAGGGWSTSTTWPTMTAALLATHPDWVLYNMGTNDTGDVAGYEQRTDLTVSAIEQMLPATHIGLAFIQYSNAQLPGLPLGEARVNDALYRVCMRHSFINTTNIGAAFGGLANFQDMQSTYLDAGGVHPNAQGYEIMAHKLYDANQVRMAAAGWNITPIPYAYPPLTGGRPAGS